MKTMSLYFFNVLFRSLSTHTDLVKVVLLTLYQDHGSIGLTFQYCSDYPSHGVFWELLSPDRSSGPTIQVAISTTKAS